MIFFANNKHCTNGKQLKQKTLENQRQLIHKNIFVCIYPNNTYNRKMETEFDRSHDAKGGRVARMFQNSQKLSCSNIYIKY